MVGDSTQPAKEHPHNQQTGLLADVSRTEATMEHLVWPAGPGGPGDIAASCPRTLRSCPSGSRWASAGPVRTRRGSPTGRYRSPDHPADQARYSAPVTETREFGDSIAVALDEKGKPVGVELLMATDRVLSPLNGRVPGLDHRQGCPTPARAPRLCVALPGVAKRRGGMWVSLEASQNRLHSETL